MPPSLIRAAGVTLLVAAAIFALSHSWNPPELPAEKPVQAAHEPTKRLPLGIYVFLPENRVERDESFEVSVSIHSDLKGEELTVEGLRYEAPGFTKSGSCWSRGFPACVGGRPAASPSRVPPGDSLELTAELTALRLTGSYGHLAQVACRSPSLGRRVISVEIGPVQITTGWYERLRLFSSRLYLFVRDLALPVGLALLGFFFTRWASERDREQRRRAQEEAQIRETWNQLLQRNLSDSQKYYMPLKRAALTLARAVKQLDLAAPTPDQLVKALYAIVSLLATVRLISRNIGGFHFKSQAGEKVAQLALGSFTLQAAESLGERPLWAVAGSADPDLTLDQFERRFVASGGRTVPHLLDRLKEWIRRADEPLGEWIATLEILYAVVGYEANLALSHWYGETPEKRQRTVDRLKTTCRELMERLPAKGGRQEALLAELRHELGAYLDGLEDELDIPHRA